MPFRKLIPPFTLTAVLCGNLWAHLIEGARNSDIVIYQWLTIFLSWPSMGVKKVTGRFKHF